MVNCLTSSFVTNGNYAPLFVKGLDKFWMIKSQLSNSYGEKSRVLVQNHWVPVQVCQSVPPFVFASHLKKGNYWGRVKCVQIFVKMRLTWLARALKGPWISDRSPWILLKAPWIKITFVLKNNVLRRGMIESTALHKFSWWSRKCFLMISVFPA